MVNVGKMREGSAVKYERSIDDDSELSPRSVRIPDDAECKVELVGQHVHHRNWRGIVIALAVIAVVCALIIVTIILISPKDSEDSPKQKFTFEDFISKKYSPKGFHHSWIKGADAFFYRNKDGAVLRYNCSTNSSSVVMDNSTFSDLDTDRYIISPDQQFVLLPYNVHKIYRHSTLARYVIYNLNTKQSEDLVNNNNSFFQYVAWSPMGNSLVFVQDNDIYYKHDADVRRVTTTGVPGVIFNGVPDWVYEEEVILGDSTLWWSADGRYFVYATFNDTMVRKFDLALYGKLENRYVENERLSYPKAGTPIPTFELWAYDTKSNKKVELKKPQEYTDNRDHYFFTVTWQNEEHVFVSWTNRSQNTAMYTRCNVNTGYCIKNFEITTTHGWLDMFSPPIFTSDGASYFLIIPHSEGDAGYFRHIAMINASYFVTQGSRQSPGKRTDITTGQYDVVSISQYDDITRTIYYTAYVAGDPTTKHLYSVSTLHPNDITCLSCTSHDEEPCGWASASFSATAEHYLFKCLGPGVPVYTLRSTNGRQEDVVMEDNHVLKQQLATLALPRSKVTQIPVPNTKHTMWVKLLLPGPIKEHESIEYSFLLNVYGGPSTQKVTNQFHLGWEEYLASSHNIVIGYADGRGGSGRGDAWRHANYRHLGTTEVDDTLTAGRYFKTLPYIGNKVAIWGWSYGGYLTSSVLGQGTDVFKCGMAVAPVTDWRYYDATYTERFMGLPTPEDNKAAYDYANVSRYATNFKKSRYMVVHGTGDDNVHFQNTAQLVKALTEADVYFKTQIYTDQQHSLDRGNTKRHLYNTLEDFLLQCYGNAAQFDELNKESSLKDAGDNSQA